MGTSTIRVVEKAAAVLDLLAGRESASFTDVWRGAGLNKTTVAHLLATLQGVGYVDRTPEGRYRVGPRLVAAARARLAAEALRECAEAAVLELARRVGTTATAAAFEGGRRVRLAKAAVGREPVLEGGGGGPGGLYETATGRVLLAFADEEGRAEVLAADGLPGERWPEAGSRAGLERELARIRRRGFVRAAAAGGSVQAAVPVRDPDGRVVAAIGAVWGGPPAAARAPALLRSAAREFSADLGARLGGGRPRRTPEA